jgi:hypothetical protein
MGGTPRTTITALEDVPNIGPSIADDLRSIGIKSPHMLRGKNAVELYERLNRHVGARVDPCVLDTFMAAIDYMGGAPSRPWWKYTAKRKRMMR